MCTFKRIAVSNWELYRKNHPKKSALQDLEAYVSHLAKLEQSPWKPDWLILREKNLTEAEYRILLEKVSEKLKNTGIELIPHTYLAVAQNLGIERIHLPFSLLKKYVAEDKLQELGVIGTSIHSVEEAKEAEQLGVSYVTAGHIFITDCKPGLEPRGLEFLEKVCASVDIPVYAIGGIHPENLEETKKSGAAGACMMSEYMK